MTFYLVESSSVSFKILERRADQLFNFIFLSLYFALRVKDAVNDPGYKVFSLALWDAWTLVFLKHKKHLDSLVDEILIFPNVSQIVF